MNTKDRYRQTLAELESQKPKVMTPAIELACDIALVFTLVCLCVIGGWYYFTY